MSSISDNEPDLTKCRARKAEIWDLAICLIALPHTCPWAEGHNLKTYCFHPNRKIIIARTESGPSLWDDPASNP